MKISAKALALSLGISWGLSLFILTILATYTGYLQHVAELLIGVYPYYEVTLQGAFAGIVWGFIEGVVAGLIIAWIYNIFAPGSAA